MFGNNINHSGKDHFFADPVLCRWLFSMIFICLCLAATYFIYHSYRTENVKDEVERHSLDLLGFIELDADRQFTVPQQTRSAANKYLYDIVGARGNQGLAYIWSETDNAVVWPLDEQWDEQQTLDSASGLEQIKLRHVTLIRNHLKNQGLYGNEADVQLPQAIPVNVNISEQGVAVDNTYMTSGQLISLDGAGSEGNKTNNYLYVVAKSMQAVDDDLAFLTGLAWRFLLLLNVLFALDWLICRFLVRPVQQVR